MDQGWALAVSSWRYDGIYAFYNPPPDAPQDLEEMLDGRYHAVLVEQHDLAGFYCIGEAAQVPGAVAEELYGEDALDIGLGMRPDLTGRGMGLHFMEAILGHAGDTYRPAAYRLVVATFNRRAIRVYERAGFVAGPTFCSSTPNGTTELIRMTRRA
jgi:ribosomal-protein-alanine N-acetyltransferase